MSPQHNHIHGTGGDLMLQHVTGKASDWFIYRVVTTTCRTCMSHKGTVSHESKLIWIHMTSHGVKLYKNIQVTWSDLLQGHAVATSFLMWQDLLTPAWLPRPQCGMVIIHTSFDPGLIHGLRLVDFNLTPKCFLHQHLCHWAYYSWASGSGDWVITPNDVRSKIFIFLKLYFTT